MAIVGLNTRIIIHNHQRFNLINLYKFPKMKVLKLFEKLSFFANLCNKNGIYVSGVRIPNWLIDTILLSPMTICTIQMIVFCFVHGTTLVSISVAVYLSLGIFSIVSMYICFAIKNDLLIITIDHLQETVEQRAPSRTVFISKERLFQKFLFFRYGKQRWVEIALWEPRTVDRKLYQKTDLLFVIRYSFNLFATISATNQLRYSRFSSTKTMVFTIPNGVRISKEKNIKNVFNLIYDLDFNPFFQCSIWCENANRLLSNFVIAIN